MMREARANVLQADKLIEESVAIFISHAQANLARQATNLRFLVPSDR